MEYRFVGWDASLEYYTHPDQYDPSRRLPAVSTYRGMVSTSASPQVISADTLLESAKRPASFAARAGPRDTRHHQSRLRRLPSGCRSGSSDLGDPGQGAALSSWPDLWERAAGAVQSDQPQQAIALYQQVHRRLSRVQ